GSLQYLRGRKVPDTGRSPLLRYSVVVLSVAVLTVIRLLLYPVLGTHARFLTYVLPVMLSGWYGGLGPGLLAAALSAFLGPLLFPEPLQRGQSLTDRYALWELAFFSAIGVVISILNNALQLEVAERRRAERASRAQARTLVDVVERLAQEHDLERLQELVLAAIVKQRDAEGGAR